MKNSKWEWSYIKFASQADTAQWQCLPGRYKALDSILSATEKENKEER